MSDPFDRPCLLPERRRELDESDHFACRLWRAGDQRTRQWLANVHLSRDGASVYYECRSVGQIASCVSVTDSSEFLTALYWPDGEDRPKQLERCTVEEGQLFIVATLLDDLEDDYLASLPLEISRRSRPSALAG